MRYALNNPLVYTDPDGEWVAEALAILVYAYYGGTMANFWHSAENNTNPFNPGNWDWGSFNTYYGIASGAFQGYSNTLQFCEYIYDINNLTGNPKTLISHIGDGKFDIIHYGYWLEDEHKNFFLLKTVVQDVPLGGVDNIRNIASGNLVAGTLFNATNGGGVWNKPITRAIVPDFISLGVGFNGIVGTGAGSSIELRWVTRGPEASWKPMVSVTQSVGGGFQVDATLNVEGANYTGNVNNIRRSMIQTSTPNGDFPTIWGAGGLSAGGKLGVTGYVTPNVGGSLIIGREINIGAGLPAGLLPVNGAGGVSDTWILYDFYH